MKFHSINNIILNIIMIFLTLIVPVCTACADATPRANTDAEVMAIFGRNADMDDAERATVPEWSVGQQKQFKVLDVGTGKTSVRTAEVFLITDNFVFWCDTASVDKIPQDLAGQLIRFDAEQFPALHEIFGRENSPGIDMDPRIHVIYTSWIGDAYNGYFSSMDTADPKIRPGSNGMDMVFLHPHLFDQGSEASLDTLTHELQHMIHFAADPNEMSFINEGMSCLAEYMLLGIRQEIFIRQFLNDTGRSLIWWPESGTNGPYYGSAFLFSVYLYDRFGSEFIRTLTEQAGEGLDGVDQALAAMYLPGTADEVFAQWMAALLGRINRQPVRDLDYSEFLFPSEGIFRDIQDLPVGIAAKHEVSQYGMRFYRTEEGPIRITVTGNYESPVTSLPIPGGKMAWWSGAVSQSAALLRHDFDLTDAVGPLRFDYDAVYSIENGFDYYYLLLEDENGQIRCLYPSTYTESDPAGQNLGGGTTGNSNGVVHESIDLEAWRGQHVRLTFVYLTDTAALADGLLLDNFHIDAIGFADDAETSDGAWAAEGFQWITHTVPQQFLLTVLDPMGDDTSAARFYFFSGGEPFVTECSDSCVFGISAISRGIRSRASFSLMTEPVGPGEY